MPSETINLPGFFSDDTSLPSERHGFWKSDALSNYYATSKSVTTVECQPAKSFELHQSFLMWDQKMNQSVGMQVVGTERTVSQSSVMLRPVVEDPGTRPNLNVQPRCYYSEGGKIDTMSTKNENSLFSRPLPELFRRNLRLSSNNDLSGHSVDTVASHTEEEEPFESLEEIEAKTIGNLLPSDDDLFNGMTDKMDNINQLGCGDDVELDFFSSVGGLDLGDVGSAAQNDNECPAQPGSKNGSVVGEDPYSIFPSRTLFVRNINSNVEDSELRALFEPYGDIHTLYTSCKNRGFVMISYYDIRAATKAKQALQNIPLRRRKLDIHYSIPKDNPSDKDINQGALIVFNLDSSISNDELRQIFCAYGEIKEIRETLHRSQHRIIEFYDVRATEAALRELNMSYIAGRRIRLELSSAWNSRRLLQQIPPEFKHDEGGLYAKQNNPPNNSTAGFLGPVPCGGITSSGMSFLESAFHRGISSSVPNSLSSLLGVESPGSHAGLAEAGHMLGQLKFDIQGSPNFHPNSLPEHDGLKSIIESMSLKPPERIDDGQLHRASNNGQSTEINDGVYGSAINGSSTFPGHHYAWGNSYHPPSPGVIWPTSPTTVNGNSMTHTTAQLHAPTRPPPPVLTSVLPVTNHHVGSAPNCSLWERRRAYAGESPDTAGLRQVSLGSLRISNSSVHALVSPTVFSHVAGKYMELSIPPKRAGFQPQYQRSPGFPGRGQISPMSSSFESPNERARSRRNEGSINQADKKQYELDLDRILQGEDKRTTLMIKNIPNKYTSKMLLAAIDERNKGTYDFIYLPIDFKNKCNVGYAFINMIEPSQIIPFYQAFNGKKWEKFNSEKVASLAYARIQGKAALIAHFQNSSLMNEDKRCRPILFNTDGPNAGDQVPFPMGVNVRTRPGKTKTVNQEENQQGGPPNSANGEDSLKVDASGKDSDKAN